MQKRLIMGMLILLGLGLIGIGAAQAAGPVDPGPSFAGGYEVTVTTDQGQKQTAQITIEDLKNGQVQVNYDYEGSPLGLVGEVSGQPDQGGARCTFAVNYPGVVTAQAEFTIIKVADNYLLNGQGSGIYNIKGSSGQLTGTVAGTRIRPLAPPSPTPLRTVAVVAGLFTVVGIGLCYRVLKHQGR